MSDITKVYYLKKGINCENLTKFSRNEFND